MMDDARANLFSAEREGLDGASKNVLADKAMPLPVGLFQKSNHVFSTNFVTITNL